MPTDSTWRRELLGERVMSGIPERFAFIPCHCCEHLKVGGFCYLYGPCFPGNGIVFPGWWFRWQPDLRIRALAEEGRNPFEGAFAHLTEPPAIDPRPIWEQIAEIGAKVPDEELAKIPRDASVNLDHYLYGAPKEQVSKKIKGQPSLEVLLQDEETCLLLQKLDREERAVLANAKLLRILNKQRMAKAKR